MERYGIARYARVHNRDSNVPCTFGTFWIVPSGDDTIPMFAQNSNFLTSTLWIKLYEPWPINFECYGWTNNKAGKVRPPPSIRNMPLIMITAGKRCWRWRGILTLDHRPAFYLEQYGRSWYSVGWYTGMGGLGRRIGSSCLCADCRPIRQTLPPPPTSRPPQCTRDKKRKGI